MQIAYGGFEHAGRRESGALGAGSSAFLLPLPDSTEEPKAGEASGTSAAVPADLFALLLQVLGARPGDAETHPPMLELESEAGSEGLAGAANPSTTDASATGAAARQASRFSSPVGGVSDLVPSEAGAGIAGPQFHSAGTPLAPTAFGADPTTQEATGVQSQNLPGTRLDLRLVSWPDTRTGTQPLLWPLGVGSQPPATELVARPVEIANVPDIGPDVGPDIRPVSGPELGAELGAELGPEVGSEFGPGIAARTGQAVGQAAGQGLPSQLWPDAGAALIQDPDASSATFRSPSGQRFSPEGSRAALARAEGLSAAALLPEPIEFSGNPGGHAVLFRSQIAEESAAQVSIEGGIGWEDSLDRLDSNDASEHLARQNVAHKTSRGAISSSSGVIDAFGNSTMASLVDSNGTVTAANAFGESGLAGQRAGGRSFDGPTSIQAGLLGLDGSPVDPPPLELPSESPLASGWGGTRTGEEESRAEQARAGSGRTGAATAGVSTEVASKSAAWSLASSASTVRALDRMTLANEQGRVHSGEESSSASPVAADPNLASIAKSSTPSNASRASATEAESSIPLAELPRELPHTVRLALQEGRRQARIQLWPPELGSIEVHVELEGARVLARFHAERPEVRGWLEARRGELERALHRSGLHLERLEIHGPTLLQAESKLEGAGTRGALPLGGGTATATPGGEAARPESALSPSPFGGGPGTPQWGGGAGSGGTHFYRTSPEEGPVTSPNQRAEAKGANHSPSRAEAGRVDIRV